MAKINDMMWNAEWDINPESKNIKVLVVDDEKHMRDSLSELLIDMGFEVVTAASGEDALKRLRENRPEIALVDIKMPGMDGVEFLGKVSEEYPGVDIIIITGNATVDEAIEALKLGAYDFLRKPFGNVELKSSINRLVGKRKLEEERKRSEEKLKESEEFRKRLIESSNDCIKVLDLEGRILFMNQCGQKLMDIEDITSYLNGCSTLQMTQLLDK